MFARCGPVTAASAGQAGMTSRLPVIPPSAFRCHRYSSNNFLFAEKTFQHTDEHREPPQQTSASDRNPFNETQLAQQLDLLAPTDVLRRLFIGPHSKIRSRDINHRVNAIQSRSDQTQLIRQHTDQDAGSSWMSRRLRPAPPGLGEDHRNDRRNAFLTTMDLLRFQLKACNTPEDFLHLIAVTSKSSNPHALEYLGSDHMQRIMYNKIRNIGVNEEWHDYELERTIGFINVLRARLEAEGIRLITPWFTFALQQATMAMNTDAIRHWLILYTQHMRASGQSNIPRDQMKELLQTLLTSVRDQKEAESDDSYAWLRKAQTIQAILTDLPSSTTPAEDCSIHSQLCWDVFSHVSAYITLLSHLGPIATAEDVLHAYQNAAAAISDDVKPATIHALLRLGDSRGAWTMLATMSKIQPKDGIKLWPRLLDAIEDMPPGLLDKPELAGLKTATEQGLGEVLAHKLTELEDSMGLRWVASDEAAGGHHVVKRRIRLMGRFLEHNYVPVSGEEIPLQEAIESVEKMLLADDTWVEMHET